MTEEMFGPYRLVALLGRGGMGEVWRAVDTRKRDRVVALKRLPAEFAVDDMYRARFQREADLAAQLSEPHVIPIHDYGEIDGRLFIDMRLVEGTDLTGLLNAAGPLHPARAVEIIDQVGGALDAAHQAGLIHRDVKPSNVLITGRRDRDFAYLIDFGVARAVQGTNLTGTGAAIGTMAYMAPERFAGDGDHRADIYALGCLLHESLTGRSPFTANTLPEYMHAHFYVPPPRPSQLRAGIPPGLDGVIARALDKDPDQRFPSAEQLTAAARFALAPPRPVPAGPAPTERIPRPTGPTAAAAPTTWEPSGPGGGRTSPWQGSPFPLPTMTAAADFSVANSETSSPGAVPARSGGRSEPPQVDLDPPAATAQPRKRALAADILIGLGIVAALVSFLLDVQVLLLATVAALITGAARIWTRGQVKK